ncbi:MAG: serine--tRNA ligase [Bacteriovoracaceae bacterium]
MLDLKFIRENQAELKKAIEQKNESLNLDELLKCDEKLLELKKKEQDLKTQKNQVSKQIPSADPDKRGELIAEGKAIGAKIDEIKPKLQALSEELEGHMLQVPNIPSSESPLGKDESDNVEIKKWGELPSFSFAPKDHVEILQKNNWADFEKVGEVCGSRSYSLRNEMVLLEMAIHRFAMEKLIAKGFNLVSAPSLVREKALLGTGHFPKGRDQVYFLPEDNLYLSGTSEVQMNSFHSGDILDEDKLPILYAGYSSCFRREAGSYGRDVRGLIRVHQFMKVEQYVICKNDYEESHKMHQMLLATSEEIMQDLNLPYRIVECCTGDMGTGKYRMFDIEAWVPSEEKYRETHSASNLGEWQARRTNTRYRTKEGDVKHVHTLNNTAVATPRLLVPFIEVHQTEEGKIKIPEKLRAFMGGKELI